MGVEISTLIVEGSKVREKNVKDGKDWQKKYLCGDFWKQTGRRPVLLTLQTNGWLQSLCSGFLFLFIHCAGLWCVRHCTNTPGAWILVPECWQPKSTVQVFHLQNSSLQMLSCKSCREPGIALQAGKLQHGNLNGLPKTVEKNQYQNWGKKL